MNGTPEELARNAELERALRRRRDDPAPYAVYSDWLLSRGHPLGELIAFALADKEPAPEQLAALALPDRDLATFGWRWGLWDWLRLENNVDWMNDAFDAAALARAVFAMAPCAALRELRLGVLRWERNFEDVPAVLAEAAKHDWANDLESLVLGDVDESVDLAHHVIGAVGEPVSNAFPRLRTLVLHSGAHSWDDGVETFGLAGLDLPELESLTIETCSLSSTRARDLCAAKLPKLRTLIVWSGWTLYGADATLDDLAPLLDGSAFPGVVRLGLCNSELACDLAEIVPRARVAPRLVELDLSLGILDDAAAETLAAQAGAFRELERLDVSRNYLTPDGVRRLVDAFGARVEVVADAQRAVDGDDTRYVAVRE